MVYESYFSLGSFEFYFVKFEVLFTVFLKECTFIFFEVYINFCIGCIKISNEKIVCDDFNVFEVFNEFVYASLLDFRSIGYVEGYTCLTVTFERRVEYC